MRFLQVTALDELTQVLPELLVFLERRLAIERVRVELFGDVPEPGFELVAQRAALRRLRRGRSLGVRDDRLVGLLQLATQNLELVLHSQHLLHVVARRVPLHQSHAALRLGIFQAPLALVQRARLVQEQLGERGELGFRGRRRVVHHGGELGGAGLAHRGVGGTEGRRGDARR